MYKTDEFGFEDDFSNYFYIDNTSPPTLIEYSIDNYYSTDTPIEDFIDNLNNEEENNIINIPEPRQIPAGTNLIYCSLYQDEYYV